MAQPDSTVTVRIDADLTPLRRKVKAILSLAREANQELAALEERWAATEAKLAEFGIRLVLEEQ